jgi:hypothetical protein
MTAMLLRRIVLTLLVAFAGMCWLDQVLNPTPMPLLIDAGLVHRSDFPVCVTIRPAPIQRSYRLPYQRQKDTA